MKENDTDKFVTAALILKENNSKALYTLDYVKQKPLLGDAKKIFGDRIEADIKDGKTYQLILRKLTCSDANFYELRIVLIRGDVASVLKKAEIQLTVEGMQNIIICFCIFTAPQFAERCPSLIWGNIQPPSFSRAYRGQEQRLLT